MTRSEWDRLKANESKLVDIDLERTPAGGVEEAASAIASLAAEWSSHTERVEVWPYRGAAGRPRALAVQKYLVLENLTRRLNVAKFAERVATEDSPQSRNFLRERVFLVTEAREKGRWEPKARAVGGSHSRDKPLLPSKHETPSGFPPPPDAR
jgi:hypothetical protein